MKKGLLLTLISILLFLTGAIRISAFSHGYSTESVSQTPLYQVSAFRDQAYYRTVQRWLETTSPVEKVEEIISPSQALNPSLVFENKSNDSLNKIAIVNKNQTIRYSFWVEEEGLYHLGFEYFVNDIFYSNPSIRMMVNNQVPFNEASDLRIPVYWEMVPLGLERRYNRYGNELLPESKPLQEWTTSYFVDPMSMTTGPLYFYLEAGFNEVEITPLNSPLQVGSLYVKGQHSFPTYAQTRGNQEHSPGQQLITIEGESFTKKSDLEIKSSYYKEPAMTPYTYQNTVLNQLDGTSFSRGGMKVEYSFEIPVSGDYKLAFKAMKNGNYGIASAKNIYLDGVIPFQELSGYLFSTSRHYQTIVLGNQSEDYLFYLEAGMHTLTLETTIHPYQEIIDRLNQIKDEINAISLLVQTITGGNTDDAIDWNILRYIPDLKEALLSFADELESLYQTINEMDQGSSIAAEVSSLEVAAKQLRRVAKNPNKIGSKLAEFSQGSGSSYQLIGNAITSLLSSPLSIDQIYLFSEQSLPKPRANFFVRLWHSVASFFFSFFDARYNDFQIEAGTLEVWVGQSSLYLDIIQSMIDQDFTTQTGIKVQARIMTNPSKIVLSNATGDNPDVVLSIDAWNPYAYALRGMLTDLSKLDGFDEITQNIYANNFTPVIFEDGVYAIPETQSVFLLYYRKDILDYLDLDVPNTWQEVVNLLPVLQSHKMNFYHPLGGDSAFKGYGFVSPFIYQMGGEIFTLNGSTSTLRNQQTIQAIQYMTDLYTVYNLPVQVSSFFEHFRSGSLPIGISTVELYLQLKYAAPELAGQWGVQVVPGFYNEETDEVERWQTTYGKTSILFKNSTMQTEGWSFIKWWNQTDTQVKFVQNIKMLLGERFLILPANMNALEMSVWDYQMKSAMIEQAQWSRIPAVTPGSYIVERELSSIWNKIVIDRMNVSTAINESIPRINRELDRKFSEFGYRTNTNPFGKEYLVAMNQNIQQWIPRGYKDE